MKMKPLVVMYTHCITGWQYIQCKLHLALVFSAVCTNKMNFGRHRRGGTVRRDAGGWNWLDCWWKYALFYCRAHEYKVTRCFSTLFSVDGYTGYYFGDVLWLCYHLLNWTSIIWTVWIGMRWRNIFFFGMKCTSSVCLGLSFYCFFGLVVFIDKY